MNSPEASIYIRDMKADDLEAVLQIEALVFGTPWSRRAFQYELSENQLACLLVAERMDGEQIFVVGYIVLWLIVDEVHIANIAVAPSLQQMGIGRVLLREGLIRMLHAGGKLATLEVRVSNRAALHLYQRFGFIEVGCRQKYYRDTHEDAIIMTNKDLSGWIQANMEVSNESR